MKRVAGLVVLALLAFYGAWPAWNGYRIRAAIENQDAALLESKIAFDEVRASLKPVVKAEVDRNVERALKDAGPLGGLIGNQLKGDLANRMVESAINSIVTPVNVIKIAHDGKNLREAIERVLAEQMGGIFGGGKTAGTGEGKPAGGSGGLGGILEKLGAVIANITQALHYNCFTYHANAQSQFLHHIRHITYFTYSEEHP